MKLCCIADIHGHHREIDLPDADVLVIAGDLTMNGEEEVYRDFLKWCKEDCAQFKKILVIAGNHDFHNTILPELAEQHNVIYLENSGVEIDGIKFWGCPFTPNLPDWSYPEFPKCYDSIPEDTRVLINHAPMKGVLDDMIWQYGSSLLRKKIFSLMEKKLTHLIHGHIHSDGGKIKMFGNSYGDQFTVVNAAICDESDPYRPVNKPVMVEVE